MPVTCESMYFQSFWFKCPGVRGWGGGRGGVKKKRTSESINTFFSPKRGIWKRIYFEGGQKLPAESIPVLPALVHLPEEQEIVAATAFPKYARRVTFRRRTNQHLLHSTAHEINTWRLLPAEPLHFLQYIISSSSVFRTLLAVVSPNCSTWHITCFCGKKWKQALTWLVSTNLSAIRGFLSVFSPGQFRFSEYSSSPMKAEQDNPSSSRLNPGSLLLTSVRFSWLCRKQHKEVFPWARVWTANCRRVAGSTV